MLRFLEKLGTTEGERRLVECQLFGLDPQRPHFLVAGAVLGAEVDVPAARRSPPGRAVPRNGIG